MTLATRTAFMGDGRKKMIVGAYIDELMKQLNMSTAKAARAIDDLKVRGISFSKESISRIATGEQEPRIVAFVALLRVLGGSYDDIAALLMDDTATPEQAREKARAALTPKEAALVDPFIESEQGAVRLLQAIAEEINDAALRSQIQAAIAGINASASVRRGAQRH